MKKINLMDVQQSLIASIQTCVNSHGAEITFMRSIQKYPEILEFRRKRVARVLNLLDSRHKVVLDAGSGNGLNAVLFILCGAAEVFAVEMDPGRHEIADLLINDLGLQNQIHLLTENILKINLPKNTLDGVSSNEFLEHISDSHEFHCLSYRWLRLGGWIYGRTGANGANLIKRKAFTTLWDRVDTEIYSPMRSEIIGDVITELPPKVLERFILGTRGLDRVEILQLLNRWFEEGYIPQANQRVPKNPRTGQFLERVRHPRQLLHEMECVGFHANLIKPDFSNIFISNSYKRIIYESIGNVISFIHPLSLNIAPWIEVLGRKS